MQHSTGYIVGFRGCDLPRLRSLRSYVGRRAERSPGSQQTARSSDEGPGRRRADGRRCRSVDAMRSLRSSRRRSSRKLDRPRRRASRMTRSTSRRVSISAPRPRIRRRVSKRPRTTRRCVAFRTMRSYSMWSRMAKSQGADSPDRRIRPLGHALWLHRPRARRAHDRRHHFLRAQRDPRARRRSRQCALGRRSGPVAWRSTIAGDRLDRRQEGRRWHGRG